MDPIPDADSEMPLPSPGPDDLLVTRRSRRSTAGNRMEEALAEMLAGDAAQEDAEDDVDYLNDKEELDVFDADFASDEDEEAQEAGADVEAGEKAVLEEERQTRRSARTRLEKATDAAHARNKVSFNPALAAASPKPKEPSAKRRRVSLGGAVDAATGEAIPAHRQSQRKHTILNTSLTETRRRRSEERKATMPKRAPARSAVVLTQAQLMERALDAEEGNLAAHRDYLLLEDEKRRRARVIRPRVAAPLVRWVSRVEEARVPLATPVRTGYPGAYGGVSAGGSAGGYVFPTYSPFPSTTVGVNNTPIANPSVFVPGSGSISSSTTTAASGYTPRPTPTYTPNIAIPFIPYVSPATSASTSATAPAPAPPPTRTEKVAMNYVVHEEVDVPVALSATAEKGKGTTATTAPVALGKQNSTGGGGTPVIPKPNPATQPTWGATMAALFGADAEYWEGAMVFAGKNRPLARPTQTCPITGRPAPYRDPRTGVPYADAAAFEVLGRVLRHEFVWSPGLGTYV
ncbi:YL1 nuclear protein-domain-containing protein [Mycena rebaudengoi]|nr:YL1 nuclear protein-domain-containing protein [Mycena rebaudengoi]